MSNSNNDISACIREPSRKSYHSEDVDKQSASLEREASHEGFSSRWSYLFTAIGCAVGFGNVWRFPFLVYKHGGVAFIIVYVIILLVVVIPSCILEMGLGQICRGGQIQAWSRLGRRSRAPGMVGWVAFTVCEYYATLLCWSLLYFANSFKTHLPWSATHDVIEMCQSKDSYVDCITDSSCQWEPTTNICSASMMEPAHNFFRSSCYIYDNVAAGEHQLGIIGISGWVVLSFVVSWTCCVLALVAGAKVLGYIMYVTMTLPTVFLVALCIAGGILDGSLQGVQAYIAKFNIAELKVETWVDAVSQGVFSVGVAQGTLAAFTAHNAKGQNFVIDGIAIVIADTLYALLSGFIVFSVIGFLSKQTATAISDLPINGLGLAFLTYPIGMSQVPGVGANIMSVLFFATLWLIDMDTLVCYIEALVLMLCNSRMAVKLRIKRWHAIIGFSAFFFLVPGLLFSTNIAYSLLDAMDNYNTLTQALGAMIECGVAGWIYLNHHIAEKVGYLAYSIHAATFFAGSILVAVLTQRWSIIGGIVLGFGIPILGFIIAVCVSNKTDDQGNTLSFVDRMYYLSIYNLEPLRKLFNDTGCVNTFWHVPLLWDYLIKYIIPFVVLYLVVSGVVDPVRMYQRPSESSPYPWFIFFISQASPYFMIICIVMFLLFPDTMVPLLPPDCSEDDPILAEELVPLFDRKGSNIISDGKHYVSSSTSAV